MIELPAALRDALILAALNGWVALRYSAVPLGQDEGLWMLWGWTGALPYRDHVDCKPPGIHLWLWALARLTRRNIRLTRFITHLAIGGLAIAAALIAGDIDAGLLFTALAQSSWLLAYHAWVEPLSAGLLLLALLSPSWPATLLIAMAALVNAKLALPGVLFLLLRGRLVEPLVLALAAIAALAIWRLVAPGGLRDVWYGLVVVPRRMVQRRKEHGQRILPAWNAYVATPLLLVAPAIASGVAAEPDPALWLPASLYIGTNLLGRVWRPYHWVPLAAFAAAAAPEIAPFVLLAEWAASGLYLGNVERHARPQVAALLDTAGRVGERLRGISGALWVDDEFTQIYVYARKRPARPLVEQVEIRHVVADRRADESRNAAPDLVVLGPGSVQAAPRAFRVLFRDGPFTVLQRTADPGMPDSSPRAMDHSGTVR